ncbi:hypothetical protein [Streptomyces sp. NPDC004726]
MPDWPTAIPSPEKLDLRWNDPDPPPGLVDALGQRRCVVLLL